MTVHADEGDLGKKIMLLVTGGGQPTEIQRASKEAKKLLFDRYVELFRVANMIDSIVMTYAPDMSWQWGLVDPFNPPPPSVGRTSTALPRREASRKDRILALAQQIIDQGNPAVTTQDIAERLRAEGATEGIRNLMTSVGNTLTRSGWKRLSTGEYQPGEESEGN